MPAAHPPEFRRRALDLVAKNRSAPRHSHLFLQHAWYTGDGGFATGSAST